MNINKIFKISLFFFVFLFFLSLSFKIENKAAVLTVEKPAELRGVWVATVFNIDIDKQSGTLDSQKEAYKEKLMAIIKKCEYYGINAVFFQIRPANDALYESDYNPWSEFLVGRGINPGWDMLTWFIDECHAHGIEFHAWLNPYRVSASVLVDFNKMDQTQINNVKLSYRAQMQAAQPNVNNPLYIENDAEFLQAVVAGKEGQLILNPAKQTTIDHINNTISEIITKYNVDGIHFDDYFYPSGGIETGVENVDYNNYTSNGGTLSIADWRRENVNRMVESVHNIVTNYNNTHDHYVAFGISPAAVWAPSSEKCHDSRGQDGGMDVICGSYSSYNDLYADTRLWVRNEWLDYILPQNYYNFGDEYKEVASWWSKEVKNTKVKLYIGTPLYRVPEWKDSQLIKNQFDYIYQTAITKQNVSGFVLFSYRNLTSVNQYLSSANQTLYTTWKNGALHPVYKESSVNISMADLNVKVYQIANKYVVKFNQLADANGYAMVAVKKTNDTGNLDNQIIAKVYNQTSTLKDLTYEIPITGTNINNFYLRVFDKNNNEVGFRKIDFENALENPGPTVTAEYNNKIRYEVGQKINFKFDVESNSDLPLTVTLHISQDGEFYMEHYEINPNIEGLYEYDYSPFMEGIIYVKVTVTDTDKEVTLELGKFYCGIDLPNDDPDPIDPDPINPDSVNPKPVEPEKKSCKNSCKKSSIVVLSIVSALSMLLIILKKKGK